jgi:hypothetical protein
VVRHAAIVWAVLLGMCAVPVAAGAHGGFQVAAGTDGPYAVVVRARPYAEGGRWYVDLTSYVVRQSIGEPDLTPSLALRLTGPDGAHQIRPRVVGDGYEAIVPVGDADAWRQWRIDATVRGDDGTSRITGGPVGEPPGAPGWVPWAGAGTVALLLVGGVWMRRRRRVGPADDVGDDWPMA